MCGDSSIFKRLTDILGEFRTQLWKSIFPLGRNLCQSENLYVNSGPPMKKRAIKLLIVPLILCSLTAQTTEEIRQKAEQSGLTETQIRELGKQRGLSEQQIESTVNKYKKRQDTESSGQSQQRLQEIVPRGPQDVSVEEQEITDVEEVEELFEPGELEEELLPERKPQPAKEALDYYGYSIFGRDPALFQASVFGAIDPDYSIGPGDQIILLVWGETQFREEFVVNREGFIFVPQLGQMYVNGLTIDDLELKLKKLLSRIHKTLNPDDGKRATTFMDVTLGNLRPLRILVLGEVAQPGAYTVNSSTSLFTSLYYFNGPTKLGSLRNIRLVRSGQTVTSIDFYDYLLTGEQVNDVRLQLDDVVFIPVRRKTVSIRGEVKRPAIYELKPGEGLKELLEICGGLNITAYLERIQVDRVVDFDRRGDLGMERMYIDVDLQHVLESEDDFDLQDGDEIQVFSVLDLRKNVVQISGQVERPGMYDVGNSIKLSELTKKAGGLIGDAYMGQANIVRLRPDLTEELIRVEIQQALEGDPDHDIALQGFDRVRIFNTNTVFNLFKPVWIRGSIKNPGRYSFYDGMTIRDLILTSGGLSSSVYRFKLEIARVDPNNPSPDTYVDIVSLNLDDYYSISDVREGFLKRDEFLLRPYDIVFVRPDPYFNLQKQVTVTGPVLYPGTYTILSPYETVTDILNRAGGLRPQAYPKASRLIRGGKTIKLSFEAILENPRSDLNFEVLDGDQIIIATKPNVVSIIGEVNAPGLYTYLRGANARQYIKMAGGYTPDANKGQVWVEFPDGKSAKLQRFLPAPKVEDGSTISVGREKETEPIDKTELAKEIASILASLVTTLFVISQL